MLLRANSRALGSNLVKAIGAQGISSGVSGTFTDVAGGGYIAIDYKSSPTGTTPPAATAALKPGLVLP